MKLDHLSGAMLKMKIGVWGRPRSPEGGNKVVRGEADPLVWVETNTALYVQSNPSSSKEILIIWDEAHITKSLVWT